MKKFFPAVAIAIVALLLPVLSMAHEGHGHTHGFTIKHYFVEPEHVVASLLAVAVGVWFFRAQRKKSAA